MSLRKSSDPSAGAGPGGKPKCVKCGAALDVSLCSHMYVCNDCLEPFEVTPTAQPSDEHKSCGFCGGGCYSEGREQGRREVLRDVCALVGKMIVTNRDELHRLNHSDNELGQACRSASISSLESVQDYLTDRLAGREGE